MTHNQYIRPTQHTQFLLLIKPKNVVSCNPTQGSKLGGARSPGLPWILLQLPIFSAGSPKMYWFLYRTPLGSFKRCSWAPQKTPSFYLNKSLTTHMAKKSCLFPVTLPSHVFIRKKSLKVFLHFQLQINTKHAWQHRPVSTVHMAKLFVSCNPTLTSFYSKKSLPLSFFCISNSKKKKKNAWNTHLKKKITHNNLPTNLPYFISNR